MNPVPLVGSLDAAVSALVVDGSFSDALTTVMDACVESYPAAAVGVLATGGDGSLELVGATHHATATLELLQVLDHHGPCVEAMSTGAPVIVDGLEDIARRWEVLGPAITEAGYTGVHAYPMGWNGTIIGALNVFLRSDQPTGAAIGRVFANLATLALVRAAQLPVDEVHARIEAVVAERATLEQAKGVLAYRLGITFDEAHLELLKRRQETGSSLLEVAEQIIADQHS